MTTETETAPTATAATSVADVVGTAVVATGEDVNGEEALAVWQVSPDGRPTGAWIVTQEVLAADASAAERLMRCVRERALTSAEPDGARRLVERLGRASGQDFGPWWDGRLFSTTDVVADIVARRAEFDETLAAVRSTRKNIAPLEWTRELPTDGLPETLDGLRRLATIAVPDGPPVVSTVLTVTRTLRWLVEMWGETEQAKDRRSYLHDRHGEPELLPPRWLTAMSAAASGVRR